MSEAALPQMNLEEFLPWQESQEHRHELVDGQPVAMAGAKRKHDRIVTNALVRIGARLEGGPCSPFTADTTVVDALA